MTEGGTPENENKDNASQGAEKPRRRRQSASGAVDRITGIVSREKESSEGSEPSADEDSAASSNQEEVVEPEEEAQGSPDEVTGWAPERSFERSPERGRVGAETREEPISAATASGRGNRRRGAVTGAREDRVRASVDLSRQQHKFLKMFAVQNDSDGMSILRELVGMLEEDEDIAPRLVRRLADPD